ncbi:hypothetical protein, partial [Pseudomonas viridiflava]|uniref:hypothetical protein n=1 Tax=Pseudomonas viridiflava TaxID=33069 RepID=UPI0013D722B4
TIPVLIEIRGERVTHQIAQQCFEFVALHNCACLLFGGFRKQTLQLLTPSLESDHFSVGCLLLLAALDSNLTGANCPLALSLSLGL